MNECFNCREEKERSWSSCNTVSSCTSWSSEHRVLVTLLYTMVFNTWPHSYIMNYTLSLYHTINFVTWFYFKSYHCLQEAQLMLTNLHDMFTGQLRSPNIVPFHMLGVVSNCAIVTLSLRCAIFPIVDFKNAVTLKSGSEVTQVYWKLYHSIDCIWFPINVL